MKFSTIHSCLSSNSNSPHFTLKFLKLFVVAPWMPLAAALPWREAAVYVWGLACGLHRDASFGGLTLGYQFGILFETKFFIENS